jgi:sugar O-acyltransferase (sialic acid O-acetyltransferase NeuD family)
MKWLILGAGGHSRVVADAVLAAWPEATIAGHLDDDHAKVGDTILGRPVLGLISSIDRWEHDAIALGIGDNLVRASLFERLAPHHRMPRVVHPRATVSPSVTIGDATVLFAGTVVNAGAVLRENVIVNTGATVDHDAVLEAHAHVGPGSTVNGGCVLGRGALLTTGVIVGHYVRIGEWTVVGAGSVVLHDLPGRVLAYGAPAKVARALG